MPFLAAAHDGRHVTVPMHERLADCGTLVPLPAGLICLSERIDRFRDVRASTFNAARSLRAFHLMSQIDWARIDRLNTDGVREPFLSFNFNDGTLYNTLR